MKKEYRIKKSSEIDAIFHNRKAKNNQYYGIYQKTNEKNQHFRFALSIGKKYGNAVERNLAKRRMRMIVLEFSKAIEKRCDFVIVIKPKSNMLNFQEMRLNILELMKKSKIMENKHEEL
jgi:ribonuclease P protein component